MGSARRSVHIEPIASLRIASHSIREVIYGANDSMVTVLRRCSWLSAAACCCGWFWSSA